MNKLEEKLFDKIKNQLKNLNLKELKPLSSSLSQKYKQQKHKFFSSDKERLVYLACRMPATFAALTYVLKEIKLSLPNIFIKNVLDLGSGPATTAWAMFHIFDEINKIHLVEKDEILSLGKKLLKDENFYKKITFEKNEILKIKNYNYDIVCLSYVTTEMKRPFIEKIIKKWFYSDSKIIIFLEPGTMYGFKNIRYIRQQLIKLESKIIAPCPNELNCPMQKNDWCHFSVRLSRSKQHKYLKSASLAYEDEKFSYVIATKIDIKNHYARILRRPKKDKGEILLTLCYQGKMIKETISKKNTKRYKISLKLRWGDRFDV